MALALRLLTLTTLCASALLAPAWADLQVSLDGRSAVEKAAAPRARTKAPAKKKPASAKARTPAALPGQPTGPALARGDLASRSMPQQVGVVRRGAPPILPPVDGTSLVPEAAIAAPQAVSQVTVNARLGRMLAYKTDVYKLPDPRSQWVGKLSQGQQVAILSQWEGWYAIVMGDGSQAYVPSTHVEVLPYQVKTVSPVAPSPPPAPVVTSGQMLLAPAGAADGAGPAAPYIRVLIQEAFKYEGAPYVYGGNGAAGIDCSGLVKNCFASLGVSLPRRASEQATVGATVALTELQPGDRLYFSVKRQFDHTGIYLGNGYFIHASASRRKVAVDHLSTPLYGNHLEAARRF